jgi:hypothetical protein
MKRPRKVRWRTPHEANGHALGARVRNGDAPGPEDSSPTASVKINARNDPNDRLRQKLTPVDAGNIAELIAFAEALRPGR